ncbi:MAG: TetR/AcrR family transcriptional regulator [Eubacteriales bacterium]|nr:TetR/AcrR family transcriptional regulator [Eubacteriales bacterium]
MEKRDLRVQKTYTALFGAFQTLLEKKKFDEITVRELCDLAMVRTATFYKHFSDKYDFAVFMVKELLTEFNLQSASKEDLDGVDYYLDLIRDGLLLIRKHELLIRSLDADTMMMLLTESFRDNIRKDLLSHLEADRAKGHALAAEPELLACVLIGSMNQIGKWWLAHREECDVDALTEKLTVYVERMLG